MTEHIWCITNDVEIEAKKSKVSHYIFQEEVREEPNTIQ
jgi:hypothetical protein